MLDLKDHERALIWIDGRFSIILDAGLYALWAKFRNIQAEIIDARNVLFEHEELHTILKSAGTDRLLNMFSIEQGQVAVCYQDGEYLKTLTPGQYASWMKVGKVKMFPVDIREKALDITGQDIMTADKVTLRINAILNWQVTDAVKSVETIGDIDQALYRKAQLALRAIIGTRDLDSLLADKNALVSELESTMIQGAHAFGAKIISLGIRDIILPGEIKTLLNKVIEAKKASEANVIARREEIAAMRSQLNTAKLIESTPALIRLKELEVLEKVAENSKLNIMLGEKGLTDRIVNLL